MARRGFTLIEVMVAASIGVLMLALVTGALMGIRSITQRNQQLLNLHGDAASINRILQVDAGAALPGAKWEMTADPGPDAAWGTGDEILTLTWMAALSDPLQSGYGLMRESRNDLTWCRLRWIGSGVGQPSRLLYTRNSGFWTGRHNSVTIHMDPLPRRDRRRDLNDNDLRYVPGLTTADYTAIAMPGDATDLDRNLLPLHSPTVSVEDVRIAWIDRGGWRTIVTPDDGIIRRDAGDAIQALSGGPWDNQQRVGVDGIFLDARTHTAPGETRSVAETRPYLLQISFTLVEHRPLPGGASDPARLRIDLSLPTVPESAIP